MMQSQYNEAVTNATLAMNAAKRAIHETIEIKFEGSISKFDREEFAKVIIAEERAKRLSKYLYLAKIRKREWKNAQLTLF